jgi:hypothetical protein
LETARSHVIGSSDQEGAATNAVTLDNGPWRCKFIHSFETPPWPSSADFLHHPVWITTSL